MWEYLAVLLIGFWLGVAILLYFSCYWLEEILDLPPSRNTASASTSQASASGAHVQLKRLVARVVEEAAALPALARYAAEPSTPSIDSSTYEDLLATAILNKVIERYQTENGSGGRSSGIHSASASPTPSERSSPRSMNSRHRRDVTTPIRDEEDEISDWEEGGVTTDDALELELPRRVPFPEFGGDIVHTDNNDRDFDEVSGSDIQAADGTWEENWLFQKKKIKTIQSVPVPMLVPNSNTEYRALIGDRDADDTTDLSDNASEPEEEEAEFKSDIKRILDSKHVIGGKPKIDDSLEFEPDSLTIINGSDDFEKYDEYEYEHKNKLVDAVNGQISNKADIEGKLNGNVNEKAESGPDSILVLGIDSGPLPKAEFSLKEEIHRTVLSVGNTNEYNDDSNVKINGEMYKNNSDNLSNNEGSTNTFSRHEKEGEYEETVSIPVQRYADSLRRKHFEEEPQQIPTRDTDQDDDLIPGSIAYRERKKWLNYVEMPNNPYSPEAIQKRLTAKNTSSFFDMITTKTKDLDEEKSIESKDVPDGKENQNKKQGIPDKEELHLRRTPSITLTTENISTNDRSTSPPPKVLKDALAEEIPQYKRYGRDYYIKEARVSSGCRKKSSFSDTSSVSSMNKSTSLDNFDTEFTSPGLLIKQFNNIAKNQDYNKFIVNDDTKESITTTAVKNNSKILIEYEDANENTLFSAKQVYIDADTDKKFEEILNSAYNEMPPLNIDINKETDEPQKSPNSVDNSYISSSSLEDSIKIYNVQTGEIVKCVPDDTLSTRYDSVNSNNNTDMPDNNISSSVDRFSEASDVNEKLVNEEHLKDNKTEHLDKISEYEEILSQLPKVKELAKKFVSMENINEPIRPPPQLRRQRSKENILNSSDKPNKVYMHSLTARSISKEFREELKLSMATPLTVPGGSKEIPEGEEVTKESSRPGSPLPEPGTLKTKLAFFESLKSKFSSK